MIDPVKRQSILLFSIFVAAMIGCGVGCAVAIKLSLSAPPPGITVGEGHEWLHEKLELTAEQRISLEEIEEKYEETQIALLHALNLANQKLGEAIERERSFTPEVEAAVEAAHQAMADLQMATVEHLFEMEGTLTPRQYELLLKLAGDSLRN